jgi:hypothetical protein
MKNVNLTTYVFQYKGFGDRESCRRREYPNMPVSVQFIAREHRDGLRHDFCL